ncbi:proline--tRNA ligase [Chromobacterium violaceum]|uniref:Proline--tRNA ligase n=1 Tax=Chromobacterium violaceum (strain ATCC 12472 / DSM 30191 / JCM 1249 / CCUG 213 / NBRC 12614 / NCIMB 9131 / NCTC 9757 / MK) TaxID=243365 RepID=SYP_CHRVO|nr:proline--tRNA ligase [Chromobacterium violaceum]Q7P0J3.1 RecName: Full=Proline--tRNA ligase; AltName: Full=Prolyl-tRNA synthetase; Short=ProRS [Chromobacterium violaceum ATCC 12472]AAQ58250.1 prolyl-tRNA synthetase [Chromobacterium violaceum ATCC 12472]ATP27393.1 proline--tRNA ligase [Chromobacterium violaceum]ATP31310.1 proline--tRNA ligase [Chromobacterium violaceum]KJH66561.1 proline--tRNA ligase [Chromobacterium violaceum]KMN50838.1 proline--tRNA ligase [Chromobacterium violaceum]
MRASQFFISTLKEAPADADITSQKLMIRAGFIRKQAAGIYSWMPMGLRVVRKVETIIREEMNRAGGIEVSLPVVQPAELWQETGRWDAMGAELLRFKDRHERDFALQPTAEEVITDIARRELRSYRALPKNFYQIQTKFRDERRPRFGVMRGREFTMKDAYSFDRSAEDAGKSYDNMYAAYRRIFDRLGLTYRAVAADTGAIGGDRSHEFQVIADTGEDAIVYCPTSEYAANIELAEAVAPAGERPAASAALAKVHTPKVKTIAELVDFLKIDIKQTVKAVVVEGEQDEAVLMLVRGDHELNEVKAQKVAGIKNPLAFASPAAIRDAFGANPGSLGPVGFKGRVIADRTVAKMADFVIGANEDDQHYTGANFGRDCAEPEVFDIRNVVEGDPSPDGQGALAIQRGIEVGHVFYLGTKYSAAMNATFLDEDGKPKPFEMGCYGIGVTRILGAAIEQNYDDKGMIWPDSIAPFAVVVCPVGYDRSEAVKEAADKLYADLQARGVDVMLDDRGERPGAMFADWELIGAPHRVTIGDRGLKEGKVEYQHRRDSEATAVAADAILEHVLSKLA